MHTRPTVHVNAAVIEQASDFAVRQARQGPDDMVNASGIAIGQVHGFCSDCHEGNAIGKSVNYQLYADHLLNGDTPSNFIVQARRC